MGNSTQDRINSLPPPSVGTATGGGVYIGVPDDYMASRTVYEGMSPIGGAAGSPYPVVRPVAPLYKTGDEYRQLSGMAPEVMFSLQQRLYNAGMLGSFVPGSADTGTVNAFEDLLSMANVQGMSWIDALNLIESGGGVFGEGSGGRTRAPLQIQLTSPDEIASIVNEVGRERYGRRLTEDEIAHLVQTFQSIEASAQQTAYAQGESGGTVTAPPSVGQYADQELRRMNPNEALATDFADQAQTWYAMLAGAR